MKRWPKIAIVMGLLSGCTVGPNFHEPNVCLPCHWTSPHIDMEEPAVKWWEQLEDETLNSLIKRTILCNWDLQKASANMQQARASVHQVNSLFWPAIGMSGTATAFHLSKDNFFLAPKDDFPFYDVTFDGFWELDVFGRIRRLSEAARANARMKCEDARGMMITLIAETARNYVQFRGLQLQEKFLYQMLAVNQDSYEMMKCLSDQGIGEVAKLLEMQGEVLNIEAQIKALEASKENLIMSLGILTSMWPSETLMILNSSPSLPCPVHIIPQAGTPCALLRRRPDIRSAEENLHVATAQVGAAIATFFPSIDVWALIGQASILWSNLFTAASRSAAYGGIISVPIFNGNKLLANLQIEEAKEKEAWSVYAKAVLRAVNEVDASVNNEHFQRSCFESIQKIAHSKEALLNISKQFFDQGVYSALQLNTAKQAWLSSESQAVQAQVDWIQSWISSYKAFGGGWQCE